MSLSNNETARKIKTTATQISLFITSPSFDVRYPSRNMACCLHYAAMRFDKK